MKKTKMWVLEWDHWSFEGVFKDRLMAQSSVDHYLENITEVVVVGEIIDKKLFIPMDNQGDWVGLYATEQDALDRLELILFEHEYIIRKVNIIE